MSSKRLLSTFKTTGRYKKINIKISPAVITSNLTQTCRREDSDPSGPQIFTKSCREHGILYHAVYEIALSLVDDLYMIQTASAALLR